MAEGGSPGGTGSESSSSATISRRLVNWLLGTGMGALAVSVLYPVAQFLRPPDRAERAAGQVDVGPVDDPELVREGYKIVRVGPDPVLVLRLSPTDVRAFSAVCTHLSCIITFQKARSRIYCNCHGGAFNLQGQVTAGPPPEPLPRYRVQLVPGGPGGGRKIVVSEQKA